jgi:hypothetical protein
VQTAAGFGNVSAVLRSPHTATTKGVDGCDRTTDLWQRMRAAVGDTHAPYMDVDAHIDQVAQLVGRATSPVTTLDRRNHP